MAQPIVVEISATGVRLGKHQYAFDGEIEPDLLAQIRPELNGFLSPGETRARAVAEAICKLHACAMSACLADEMR